MHLLQTTTQGEMVKILSDIVGAELERVQNKKPVSSTFAHKSQGASVAALGVSPNGREGEGRLQTLRRCGFVWRRC